MMLLRIFVVLFASFLCAVLGHEKFDVPRAPTQTYDRSDYLEAKRLLSSYMTPEMNDMTASELHEAAIEFAQAGDISSSLPYFMAVIEKQPYNPSFVNNLGVSLMRHSYYSAALACFLTAAYMTPTHPDAARNVAVLHGLWPDMPVDRAVMAMIDAYPEDGKKLNVLPRVDYDGVPGAFPLPDNTHFLSLYDQAQARIRSGERKAGSTATTARNDNSDSVNTAEEEAAADIDHSAPAALDAIATADPAVYPAIDAHGHITTSHTPRARLPRVRWDQLHLEENRAFRELRLPFLLTGLFDAEPSAAPAVAAEAAAALPATGTATVTRHGFTVQPASPLPAAGAPFDLAHMQRLLGGETADFYPHNMGRLAHKPYLVPLREALDELQHPSLAGKYALPELQQGRAALRARAGAMVRRLAQENVEFGAKLRVNVDGSADLGQGTFAGYGEGAYVQVNLGEHAWRKSRGAVDQAVMNLPAGADGQGRTLPALTSADDEWLRTCLRTPALVEEFTRKLHWRMLVVGRRGSGMFNHMDVLRTASYQIQLQGAKKWALCEPGQRAVLYGVDKVDLFAPDYELYPLAKHARCWEDTVEPGMLVFYPRDYWHQTINLSDLTVSLSSSILHAHSYKEILAELTAACDRGKYGWGFSKDLCSAIKDRCAPLWRELYG